MDRRIRILQRQVQSDTDLSNLPASLSSYIAVLERLAGVTSIFNLVTDSLEKEETLIEAFAALGNPKRMLPIGNRVIRTLQEEGYEASFEGLASIDPMLLLVRRGMGYHTMAACAEVLAATGNLSEQWLQFILRNEPYLAGEGPPRRY